MDEVLKRILSEQGVADPGAVVDALLSAGFEIKHSEMLQAARAQGFPSLEAYWLHHAARQTSFTELESVTGFDRRTLHTSKKRTLGRLNNSIAAQTEIWGEPPKGE